MTIKFISNNMNINKLKIRIKWRARKWKIKILYQQNLLNNHQTNNLQPSNKKNK